MESFKRWADNFFTKDNMIVLAQTLIAFPIAMAAFYGLLYVGYNY